MSKLNLRNDIDDLNYEEIYPGIIVYKNMLNDPEKAYETMMKSEQSSEGKYFFKKWEPWSSFGTYTQAKFGEELNFIEDDVMFTEEKRLFDEIAISYDRAVSHYFKHTRIEIPSSAKYSGQSWCKYFNKIDTMKNNMTMQYHTDYVISEKDMPGAKFHTTCTFYINDNYNGGELEFYIDGQVVTHKPKSGDIVIFPSTKPYFHGVKTIPDGNKFFIRNFIMFDYDGSPEWLAKQRKFGAYRWAQKEFERIEYDNPRNMLYLQGKDIISYDTLMESSSDGNKNEV
jgi:hypothetical protein